MNFFDRRPSGSAAHWLAGELRRAIIEMELPPGARLSEQEIAQKYAVSRQPVREALIALSHAHLVDIRPQRGSFVCLLSLARMREARLLREAIEIAIIRQACKAFDGAVIPEIEANLDEQSVHAKHGDRRAFQAADARFHDALARGAGFPHAWETLQALKQHTDRICKLTLAGPEALLRLADQHRAIFGAVVARRLPLASRLMHAHLTEILRILPATKARFPEWFGDDQAASPMGEDAARTGAG